MKTAIATLESVSNYCQSRPFQSEKPRNETHKDFENRVWMERAWINEDGKMFIPPMSFKNSLSEAAKFKPTQIPGKGKTTYTKHFEAGILVLEPLVVADKKDIECFELFCPADGKRGSSQRVWKKFPMIRNWKGDVTYNVLDELITADVFKQTLEDSGAFIGVGSFRPRNNGLFGRFRVLKIKWS